MTFSRGDLGTLKRNLPEEDPTVVVETVPEPDLNVASVQTTLPSKTAEASHQIFLQDAHPVVLDLYMSSKYGTSWLGWEVETLLRHVGEAVTHSNLEKLQACRTLHLVDDFWRRWEVFLPCCAAFNGKLADFDRMQVPHVAECAVAVDVANRLRSGVSWSVEMETYLRVVHLHDSVLCTQPPLDFVRLPDSNDFVDCAKVKELWPAVRSKGVAPKGNNPNDAQLRKMLTIWAYLEQHRAQLQSQLELLRHGLR